jgi:acid phosphatase family membrane protein YuiD
MAEAIAATVADFTREVTSARTKVMLRWAVNSIVRTGGPGRPSSTLAGLAEQIADSRGWDIRSG